MGIRVSKKLSNRVRYRIDGLLAVNDASQLFERYGTLCVWGDKRFEERSPSLTRNWRHLRGDEWFPVKNAHLSVRLQSGFLVSNSSMLILTNMVKPEAATGIAGQVTIR